MDRILAMKLPTLCDLLTPTKSSYAVRTPVGVYVDLSKLYDAVEVLGWRILRLYVEKYGPCRILRRLSSVEKYGDLCVDVSFADAVSAILDGRVEEATKYAAAVAALIYALGGRDRLAEMLAGRLLNR
jgi:hypothetical protein